MPRKYERKLGAAPRGVWEEEKLREAITRIAAGEIGIREAARYYGIPESTIRRRKAANKLNKVALGPEGVFGRENEKRLVVHIKRLAAMGFPLDRRSLRQLAFQFAEKLELKHPFNVEKREAGYDWMMSFLERNPDLSLRQSKGLSVARGQGLSREEVQGFYDLLQKIMTEHQLFDKPGNIFNIDESGIQIINKPDKVVTAKGSKNVFSLTSGEKGETVTVIACNNAEGRFLPPILIMKGTNKKREVCDGLPPGSDVFMNPKSAYINTDLFIKWFKEVFLVKKSPGVNVLIVDGHASHCTSLELLELADRNSVVLLCLPSHTTHALQPLDRAFFSPLKRYFQQETQAAMRHEGKNGLSRSKIGYLLGAAWKKAASVGNAVSGFQACGIFPFNPHVIPDHMFCIADATTQDPGTAKPSTPVKTGNEPSTSNTIISPTKLLHEVSPLPKLPAKKKTARKQSAVELTSPENVKKRRLLNNERELKEKIKVARKNKRKLKEADKGKKPNITKEDENPTSSDTNRCAECWENYFTTKKKEDWVKCNNCEQWMHENCTLYKTLGLCNTCGREEVRKINLHNLK